MTSGSAGVLKQASSASYGRVLVVQIPTRCGLSHLSPKSFSVVPTGEARYTWLQVMF